MKWGKPLRNQIEQKHPFSKLTSISISNLTIENYRKKIPIGRCLWTLCTNHPRQNLLFQNRPLQIPSLESRIFLIFPFLFSLLIIIGTLIGTNDTKTTPLTQGTMVPCCKEELHKSRVLKRRQGFIATASLWQLQNATECGK